MKGLSAKELRVHFKELEEDARRNGWQPDVPEGWLAGRITTKAVQIPIDQPDWARIWVARNGFGRIIGSACLFHMPTNETWTLAGGTIWIHKAWRGKGVMQKLQRQRLMFCDLHEITLMGDIAPGNWVSAKMCKELGFAYLSSNSNGSISVYREPQDVRQWIQPAHTTNPSGLSSQQPAPASK